MKKLLITLFTIASLVFLVDRFLDSDLYLRWRIGPKWFALIEKHRLEIEESHKRKPSNQ